jgi:hypothetical protein
MASQAQLATRAPKEETIEELLTRNKREAETLYFLLAQKKRMQEYVTKMKESEGAGDRVVLIRECVTYAGILPNGGDGESAASISMMGETEGRKENETPENDLEEGYIEEIEENEDSSKDEVRKAGHMRGGEAVEEIVEESDGEEEDDEDEEEEEEEEK